VDTALVLGADCGGTTSRVVVATVDGRVVGRGQGGAGNPVASDARDAAAELAAAARDALGGRDAGRLVGALVGMAGDSRLSDPAIAAAYAAQWAALGVRCPVHTVGDAVVAFASGSPESAGTVLIAGTGAVAATIADFDVARTADGLGWLLGDEGSGFWLGLSAARCAARALHADTPPTALVRAVCERVGSAERDVFVARIHQLPRQRIAALSGAVIDSARAGDPDAAALLDDAAERLVTTLLSLHPAAGPVVLAGGVLTGIPEVRDPVQERLRQRLGRSGVVGSDGAAAAAWLAVRTAARAGDTVAAALHARMLSG
jgi:glucosamine kinase